MMLFLLLIRLLPVALSFYQCEESQVGKTRIVDHQINMTYSEASKESLRGRVEVCLRNETSVDGTPFWSTVCPRSASYSTYQSICGSLYYNEFGKMKSVFRRPSDYFDSASEEQPSSYNNLNCDDVYDNLTKCFHDDTLPCSHVTDIYLECGERLQCQTCDVTSSGCTYTAVVNSNERCTSDEDYCVRRMVWAGVGGNVGEVDLDQDLVGKMGCAMRSCEEFLGECRAEDLCLCNDCHNSGCNEVFLELIHLNMEHVFQPFTGGFLNFTKLLNFGLRLFLLDISAWSELLSSLL